MTTSGPAGMAASTWSIAQAKDYEAVSVFQPDALLREARRQKALKQIDVPAICLLDPDGDILAWLKQTKKARLYPGWACYHTKLFAFDLDDFGVVGIVGCAVGASFAVLVAEQLFASGCKLLVSITSAGRIETGSSPASYFVLLDRALRDEGTSYHYLAPSPFVDAPDAGLLDGVFDRLGAIADVDAKRGATWTTDAPFRETEAAIAAAREAGALTVEMEAAALYAFARARARPVVCFAHVTNAMGLAEGDFEKGEADGAIASLKVFAATIAAWRSAPPPRP